MSMSTSDTHSAVASTSVRRDFPFLNEGGRINPNKLDSNLAEELNQLSIQDRNKILEEIHGADNMHVEENPTMIQQALKDMQHAIDEIPNEKKQAYNIAVQQLHSQYVFQTDVRLKFLRADLFQPKLAAERFVGYLDFTYQHFGNDVLLRPIVQSDLGKIELDLLRRGNNQVLPSRDRTGRLINVHQGAMTGKDITTFHRVRILMSPLQHTFCSLIIILLFVYFLTPPPTFHFPSIVL